MFHTTWSITSTWQYSLFLDEYFVKGKYYSPKLTNTISIIFLNILYDQFFKHVKNYEVVNIYI